MAGDLLFGTIDSWLIWHLTGGGRRRRPRDRRHERVADDADGPRVAGLGPGRCSTRSASRRRCCPRSARRPRSTGRASGTWPASRSRATSATSTRRCSARPASSPGQLKCTYGTGCFMLMHTGERPVASTPRADHDRRRAARRRARDLRAGGLGRGRRLADRLAPRQPRDHRRRVRGREARPLRARQRRRRVRAGVLRAVRAALAERRPGRHRRADRATRRGATSPGPRSSRPPTRSTTSARRWRRISVRHSPASCAWTAG